MTQRTTSEEVAEKRLRTLRLAFLIFFLTNMEASDSKRIVLLGKTGCGKSSLANTILGGKYFEVSHLPVSEGSLSQVETGPVNGRKLTLIDCHSVFDTSDSEVLLKKEIVRCITECAPGPHAFLIVLKVEKFTKQEKDVIQKICENVSEDALKFAAVVFTHGDQLPEDTTIEDFVHRNEELSNLVKKCGGRCHVVDNKYWNRDAGDHYRNNQFQVAELLKTIDKISEANDGRYYTNEMLEAVKNQIQEEEANMMHSSTNQSPEEARDRAKSSVIEKLMVQLVATATGAVLGAFLGVSEHVTTVVGISGVSLQNLAAQSKLISKAALSGGLQGSFVGYNAAAAAKTMSEAFEESRKAVWDSRAKSGSSVEGKKN